MINRLQQRKEYKGYLCIVLHAHLPYIRHVEREDALEERWFFEAMLETYLPLLEMFDRLDEDKIDFRITLSLSPTLLSLCADPLMQQRFARHLDQLIELANKETNRLRADKQFGPLANMYLRRFVQLRKLYADADRNILPKLKNHAETGIIELITSAATHAFLPLVKTEEAIKAQIATAVAEFYRHFGFAPKGIWLPECGYTPGLDRILKQYGINYFFVDNSAIEFATPHPNRGLYAPLLTPYGVSAFPRDPESANQVWSANEGYPGDYVYREYYRDVGWDLGWNDREEWEYIRPYVLPTFERVNTGIKYYRITSAGGQKLPYDPHAAAEKAAEHAGNFMFNREKQVEHWAHVLDRKPIVVSPYDAELFGHWWYEGPLFLEYLCRKTYCDQHSIKMITPSEYLQEYPVADTGQPAESSWGRNHSAEVWLQGNNHWIYRHLHEAEERMIRSATRYQGIVGSTEPEKGLLARMLNQAARELLLAQSSDWAFIMDTGTFSGYAASRTTNHLGSFHQLCDAIEAQNPDEALTVKLEERDCCFPEIDFRDYAEILDSSPIPIIFHNEEWRKILAETMGMPNIFMLAWEYPPKNIGGLSRAVCELSEALVQQEVAVHVVTTSHFGAPYFEKVNGVYVHRLPVLHSGDTDFYHWAFEMNLAFTEHMVAWKENGGRIDLLHAHDWMVYYAAREIKHSFAIPLAATIHATEWGRANGNLHSELSHNIHRLEWELTYEADKVFVCSEYMREEIQQLFQVPAEKVAVIPNGVRLEHADHDAFGGSDIWRVGRETRRDKTVFFVGRLVFEKGVQILIQAIPQILAKVPGTRFVIAGCGPMEEELKRMAEPFGELVSFVGFANDAEKEKWFATADVCVFPSLYEPFGIVALEAMKYRVPLVVSDTGGFAEIVEHGRDGFKALAGHVESLAWHVTELLLNSDLAANLSFEAYRKVQRQYGWDQIAKRFLLVYKDILQSRGQSPKQFALAGKKI